ncbi:hypothetical protein PVAP13_1NG148738 [Panicum virgatum]|uniref:Leucine-rich repeat-containing N-terminal plant-type domain-containing protein n=1 Tax=Panicum virgatum TaxID=38727 RepID=A0A8T0WX13_PANVG|nr:hypothetical protein PVAP13_1NG148738 [Panicum virgatum]
MCKTTHCAHVCVLSFTKMSLLAFEISLVLLLALPNLLPCANSTASQLDHQADMLLQWKSSLNYSPEWEYSLNYQSFCLETWSNQIGPCNWTSVTCNATVPHGHGRSDAVQVVTNISLPACFLEGTLDQLHFEDLSELSVLDLSNNNLNGSVPPSIGNLTKLTYLNLSNKQEIGGLSGHIPATIGMLENLETLDLGYNNFAGPIPSSLGNLTRLVHMDLSYNLLSGRIPHELGMIHSLKLLYLSSNSFNGSIPREHLESNYVTIIGSFIQSNYWFHPSKRWKSKKIRILPR